MGRYQSMVQLGEIESDPAQLVSVKRLDRLNERLAETRMASKKSALGWLFSKRKSATEPVTGLYIWGEVGRGKTMLMDLFFDVAVEPRKRRSHFHEFMAETHERIKGARAKIASGELKGSDPILPVAEDIAKDVRLLCFDEFSVTDIADAMLLGRLFTKLFEHGVVVVATSNVEPDNLYKDGLNRNHILPFIKLLKEKVEVVRLDSRTDFRLEKLAGSELYITPLGPEADSTMEQIWRSLTRGMAPHAETLHNMGRNIPVNRTCSGAAWFTFTELCVEPLAASDYLRIGHAYHTIFLSDVPVLEARKRNEAKRFINLIDALYDNGNRLVISAEKEPQDLYVASSGTEAFEFDRTSSRLIEMRSVDYLNAHAEDNSE
nr:cell division protein ZapE [Pseudovibrio flavus]